MSLKDLLDDEIKVNNIKVKFISMNGEHSIVGDATRLAICDLSNNYYKDCKEGDCYIIVKPIKQDNNIFIPNEKLRPIKMKPFPLIHNKNELKKLNGILQSSHSGKAPTTRNQTEKLTTFDDINKLSANIEVKHITVKVISLSRNIAGKFGNYNIGKIKDVNGDKMDINIYSKQVRAYMKVGNIIDLKNLKIIEYSKDKIVVKRLATTSRSNAGLCSSETEILFTDIPIGDQREEGKVVGITDIFPYLSCSNCWKKTNEDDSICQCENRNNIHIKDFHCKFYIEINKNNDIKVVHTFRRQTSVNIDSQNHEEIQKDLENKYINNSYTFEWNINNDEDLKMVIIRVNTPKE